MATQMAWGADFLVGDRGQCTKARIGSSPAPNSRIGSPAAFGIKRIVKNELSFEDLVIAQARRFETRCAQSVVRLERGRHLD